MKTHNLHKTLAKRDSIHIWHPLTQHQTASLPVPIVKAKGALVWDENGKEYIDGIASWYTAMYGHCNDHVIAAVSEQMRQLDQIPFTGFTHEPAIQLSEKLMEILPENQQKIFFNDNGSTAVEAAIKMALQFHYNKDEKRDTLIAFEDGFHGDTFGAMSTSGLSVYNGPFEEYFLKVERIPTPKKGNLKEVIEKLNSIISGNNCAAFLYEPLVQGAAGMQFHDAEGLDEVLKICKASQVLCIADEVMTGFGKTGKNFASSHMGTQPDIMCLSKSLTAGMLPMSITTATQEVYNAFLDEKITKGFMHAHTYSANPLGCAAAIAGIELLNSKQILNDRAGIELAHASFATVLEAHPKATSVRTLGVILAFELNIEMERYGSSRNQIYNAFLDEGVILRPLGNTIYILPPFVITKRELEHIYSAIINVLDKL